MDLFRECRTVSCAGVVAIAALGAMAQTVDAQMATAPSRTRGLMIGANATLRTTVQGRYGEPEIYIETKSSRGTGAGITAGWGFSKWFAVYAAVDRTVLNVSGISRCNVCDPLPGANPNPPARAKYTLWNPDIGAQINVPIRTSAFVPYARLAYTYRIAKDDDSDRTLTGPAVTTGFGLQYFFAQRLALDGALQFTTGSYTKSRYSGSTTSIGSDWNKNTQNNVARFSVGAKFYPFARAQ